MPLSRVVPHQKSIFCGANFGSKTALDPQQKLKPFLHSSLEQTAKPFAFVRGDLIF